MGTPVPEQTKEFDIPALPLGQALGEFSKQSGIAVFAPSSILPKLTTQPISGAFTAQQALDNLLGQTELIATSEAKRVFVVKVEPQKAEQKKPNLINVENEGIVTLDTIEVNGMFSNGLGKSLAVKRQTGAIVDAILASDIGKLPAVNLAEALQRVPGISITREAGEGQFVSVRGLGPNFQSVTFNSMPIAYNENIRDSGQSGRQFRFRTLPSDLVDGLLVRKSPSSDTIDGGIGSAINVLAMDPLLRTPFTTASFHWSFEDRTGSFSPSGSISTSWHDADRTLGLFAGVSFQKREIQFDRFQNNAGYVEREIEGQRVMVPGEYSTTVEEENRRRLSFLGGGQWNPNDTFELDLDLLFTQFQNAISENRILYEFGNHTKNQLIPGSARIENNVLIAAAIEGGRINRNAEFSDQSHQNVALTLKSRIEVNNWTIEPKLSYSRATSDLNTPLQRIDSQTTDGTIYRFDMGSDSFADRRIADISTDLNLLSPTAVPFRRYRIRPINSMDEDVSAATDFTYRISEGGALRTLKVGTILSDRLRDYDRRGRSLTLREGSKVDDSFFGLEVPPHAFDSTISNHSQWVGPRLSMFDQAFVVENEFDGVRPQTSDLEPSSSDLRQSYQVDEQVFALYGRLDFVSKFHNVLVTGDVGLRQTQTDSTVQGALIQSVDDGSGRASLVASPQTTVGSYSELLPSLNLRLDLAEGLLLRLAASRSLTRPSLADLRDATIPNSDVVSAAFEGGIEALQDPSLTFEGSGGNPNLSPYLATNFDASLEWYFPSFGALTFSAFHKEIENYIATDDRLETIDLAVNNDQPIPAKFLISRPRNIGEAKISGLELGYTGKASNGLGLAASLTLLVTSDIHLNASKTSANLQGVSDLNYSITPFLEKGRFETHISYTYRSEYYSNFASSVQATPASGIVAVTDGYGTLDLGASYRLSEDVELFVQGINLLDERQLTHFGSPDLIAQIHRYGATFNLGLRAQF